MLSKEDLRNKRLAALGQEVPSNVATTVNSTKSDYSGSLPVEPVAADNEDEDLRVALMMSLENNDDRSSSPASIDLGQFHAIMWGPTSTYEDQQRWTSQGIHFKKDEIQLHSNHPSTNKEDIRTENGDDNNLKWGLVQQFGGPCGVLAVLQAEILCILLFGDDPQQIKGGSPMGTYKRYCKGDDANKPNNLQIVEKLHNLTDDVLDQALAQSMATLLARAAIAGYDNDVDGRRADNGSYSLKIIIPKKVGDLLSNDMNVTVIHAPVSSDATGTTAQQSLSMQAMRYLLSDNCAALKHFKQAGGVLLFTWSMVETRGYEKLKEDFDSPFDTTLTSHFGHTTQELLNLALTGCAVSNPFNGTINLGEGMVCRGVGRRNKVGYLSQLEKLRYCQVGGYLKCPIFPVWVVGSESHFSVLFGVDGSSQASSRTQDLFETCKNAWQEHDSNQGFIPMHDLNHVLKKLKLDLQQGELEALTAALEVPNSGIILWDDFWKKISRLMSGAALESVLGENTSNGVNTLVKSDEELARELQAQWNSGNDAALVSAMTSSQPASSPAGKKAVATESESCSILGDKFPLYYYNGLRGGNMQGFLLTNLTPEEAVGASISLENMQNSSGTDKSRGLEDVVRTRWPTCQLDWLGLAVPFID
uniref:ubiquitinyl hydrolase 1 n=1 Tax=Leptocylindrus danicus TaxID=163516 RepID=A0A7S2JUK8_9STRA|mmetsp:Transcript_10989/g.16591  ORF Transcript_10989/g.16591 Transcript_10989/m.16591 type:complete len:646 (+) Transcript_10989:83-2020(+)